MPFFFEFDLNESYGILDSCVEPGEARQCEEMSCLEWVKRRMTFIFSVLVAGALSPLALAIWQTWPTLRSVQLIFIYSIYLLF